MPNPKIGTPDFSTGQAVAVLEGFVAACHRYPKPVSPFDTSISAADYHQLVRPRDGMAVSQAIGLLIRTHGEPVAVDLEKRPNISNMYVLKGGPQQRRLEARAWDFRGLPRTSILTLRRRDFWYTTQELQLGEQRLGDCIRLGWLPWEKLRVQTGFYSPDFHTSTPLPKWISQKEPKPLKSDEILDGKRRQRIGRIGMIAIAPAIISNFLELIPPQF